MSTTRTCRAADLQPGMACYGPSLGRDVRVDRVEADGDAVTVWLSADGREPFPFPYRAGDEIHVMPEGS